MEGVWEKAFQVARSAFSKLEPGAAAGRVMAVFDGAERRFHLEFLGMPVQVAFPDGVADSRGARLAPACELIVLHYLLGGGGRRPGRDWVGFRDLPGARNYDSAFHKEAELPLARELGVDMAPWRARAQELGLKLEDFGDLSFSIRALPGVELLLILTAADEEFPAEARILFDRAASDYLHTEDLSVLGEVVARTLLGETVCVLA
jgi:hypothetical protein